MNRNFLNEAIADAKAVKESAIANAKVALEEAFSPQVQAMFASKLEEMENEDKVEESYDDVDEAEITEKKEYMTKKEKREGDDRKSDNKAETKTEKMRKIKEESEFNLDEILAELEKDENLEENKRTDAEEEGYLDGMKDEKEDLDEDARTDAEEEGYLDGEKDEKEDMEDEDIDLEDMSEDDLKKFIEDVIEDMVESGEIEAGESFEVEDEEDVDIDIDVEDDVEVEELEEGLLNEEPVSIGLVAAGVASLLGGSAALSKALEKAEKGSLGPKAKKLADLLGKAGSSASDVTQQKESKEEVDEGDDEMYEVKKDLDEAISTIETLKSELNEINLLNAKLLYTSKVFRGKNLTEAQKVKVLGAFDKAETVKEVKLVFETLNSSVKAKATNKSITEGVRAKGSASNLTATPKVTKKQPIVESNEMVNRFKKLAGLI
ncbi:MAG: hypothetical protein GY936_17760 [Ignavibacteriae bacterium]|nr:hypothetical protein [Candidatus Scalindua sp.]MCP5064290.1 hypothetical protein [Ignavibacteriota bacterium]